MNEPAAPVRISGFEDSRNIEEEIRLVRGSFLFDSDWYLERYPDVAVIGADPAEHYCTQGWWLGYAPGPHFHPGECKGSADCNPLAYALRNLTLRNSSFDRLSGELANPFFRCCSEPSFELPNPGGSSAQSGPGLVIDPTEPLHACRFRGALAVHLHLFHLDMALDFRSRLETIPVPFDLFVSVPKKGDIVVAEAAFAEITNARRIIAACFENIGRDLGAMIAGFGRRLAPYDVVLHFHSKKSDHTPAKRDWAVQLIHNLLASREHTAALLEMFADDPKLGLLFPSYHPSVRKQIRWGANFAACKRLMARLGAPLLEKDLTPFPAGSFFAIRGEVLRTLLAGDLSFSDFDPESGQVDGTLAHALERFFSLLCRHLGFEFRQIRAEKAYSLSSVVLDSELYRSSRLQAFRTDFAPSIPVSPVGDEMGLTVFSGGSGKRGLPYEHLISRARYIFFGDDTVTGKEWGQWTLKHAPSKSNAELVPAAAQGLTNTNVAVWVAPHIALVDDISAHVEAVVLSGSVGGAFLHPRKALLGEEIQRLAERHPASHIRDRIGSVLPMSGWENAPVLDKSFLVFDLRNARSAELLVRWKNIARKFENVPDLAEIALDLACAVEGITLTTLWANGMGALADPRLRHFDLTEARHPYEDVMPRLGDLVHRGRCSPTPVQRAAARLMIDVVVPVSVGDSPDSLARTLQRLGSLSDERCRCLICWQCGQNEALDGVIADHLSRHLLDVVTAEPSAAMAGDLVMVLKPGMLLTPGAVQALAEAAISTTDATAFRPVTIAGLDENSGVWSGALAQECRRAAASFDPTVEEPSRTPGAVPVVVRPEIAAEWLSATPECLGTHISKCARSLPSTFVPEALVIVPKEHQNQPARFDDFVRGIVSDHQLVRPVVAPVAFYLPQFHPFDINDQLWGAGFTEWRNVVRAKPRFEGHQQPHLPGDLGYYDLRTCETLRRQGQLADLYGVHAMAIYYYRFGNRRLMGEPTDRLLEDFSIPLRFFYCWANEDWTRAWDGSSDEINLKQDYSFDTLSHVLDDLVRACADTRYVRVDGKPVFMIYQLNRLPLLPESLEFFRAGVRKRLGLDVLLGTTYNDGFRSEWEELVDFIAQFPPHRMPRKEDRQLLSGADKPREFDPNREDFFEHYDDVSRQALAAMDALPRLQPGVCPDWDNSPRRERRAHVLVGATPSAFGEWTRRASLAARGKLLLRQTRTPFMFANAWNEWAEGAVLEPQEDDGRAALNALSKNLPWFQTRSPRL